MNASLALAALLATVQHGEVAFHPGPEEPKVPALFRLDAATFPYQARLLRRTPGYSVSAVTFPSPVVSPDPANNVVHAEYFRPRRSGTCPAAVVLHILGADFALSRFLAARLADSGVAALFVKLPYYGERRPPGVDSRFLSADLERSVLAVRQGVCDVRRASQWLRDREEIDPNRVGVTGISLGGIISAVAAGVDPELDRAALVLAGGGLADILWDLPEPEARDSRRAWLDSGRSRDDLEALTRPFDPLTYADRLRDKRVLMIAGRADEVIPPSAASRLWEAAGRPSIRWYDCGHYSAAGYLLPAIREVVAFFADQTGSPDSRTSR
ncbi:alpha/beta hydrolase family protein [Tautonia sociabilis]|uniref:Abhydrolase domain-containing 18 n=1 Tax=Tautonia sociabilis TaxID=2080755 RepID=A0A432MRE7_9BACT|nr:prolyl oligopeptidase family serine peptidase [Tautonia sociabilis]RUL89535.1 abhydrolase domain-containing 18 [Tautonia sociabilis]